MQKKSFIVMGSQGVGKTTLLRHLSNQTSERNIAPTIGVDFAIARTIDYDYHFWEVCGQQRFSFLVPCYIQKADAALLVIDDSANSIENFNFWVRTKQQHNPSIPIIAIINARNAENIIKLKTVVQNLNASYIIVENIEQININLIIEKTFPKPNLVQRPFDFFKQPLNNPKENFKPMLFKEIKSLFNKCLTKTHNQIDIKNVYQKFLENKYSTIADIIHDIDNFVFEHPHQLTDELSNLMPSFEMKCY